MGLIAKLKKIILKSGTSYAPSLDGYTPIFSQFGTDIYASDVVRQAVSCIVQEMSKLNPTHVRGEKEKLTAVNDSIQSVLDNPNETMTTGELLEKVTWMLYLNYNAFIVPTYMSWMENGTEKRRYTGLYPVSPIQVDFIEDGKQEIYIKMRFRDNSETILPYCDVIHIRHEYSVNDWMGGDSSGSPDNTALLRTLRLNSDLMEGLSKTMKSGFQINGVVKYNTIIDDGTISKSVTEFNERLRQNESGILPLDMRAEFTPISRDIKLIDGDTVKFIDSKILRNFGVPLSILTGDYTTEQYNAFYQKTLEPLIISYSQAFTKKLFTDREKSFGNRIQFYPKDLIFMSVSQTLEMIRLLGDSGTLYENEKRTALGLKPLEELEGVRKQSLNYVDTKYVSQYQIGGQDE